MRKTILSLLTAAFLAAALLCVDVRAEEAEGCIHVFAEEVTEPDCTSRGFTVHVCTICGESHTDSETDPLGHDFGEWKTAAALTEKELEAIRSKVAAEEAFDAEAIEKGSLEVRFCSRCGEAETRPAEPAVPAAKETEEIQPAKVEEPEKVAEEPEAAEKEEAQPAAAEPEELQAVPETEDGREADKEEAGAADTGSDKDETDDPALQLRAGAAADPDPADTASNDDDPADTVPNDDVPADTTPADSDPDDPGTVPTDEEPAEPEVHHHTYKDKVIAATCTKQGYTKHTCTGCGLIVKDHYVDALGHKWSDWTVKEYATYTKTGIEERVCANDPSHVQTRTIPKRTRPPVIIGSARQDENGDYYDGKRGDQTGHEVETQEWYDHEKGWIVIRAASARVREMIAQCMEMICANDKVGYSQTDRFSLKEFSKKYDYDTGLLSTACNADCSSAVCVCVNYAGIDVYDLVTDTEVDVLRSTGKFKILYDTKYTRSPNYLLRGDILVTRIKGHTAVVLENGSRSGVDWEPGIIITRQLEDIAGVEGKTVTFSIGAEGEDLSYKWYKRTSSGASWTEIEEARGKSSCSLTMKSSYSGHQFCCIIRDAAGRRKASETVKLTLRKELKITSQPTDVTAKEGETVTFKVTAQGAKSYQWYFQKPGSNTWQTMSAAGGKTSAYSLAAALRHNGYKYKCVVSYGEESVTSDVVTLTVSKVVPIIKTQPRALAIKLGDTATFKVVAEDVQTYQWYYQKPNSDNWIAVTSSAGKKAAYSFTTLERHHNYRYKCVLTYGKEVVETNAVRLTVVNAAPEITSQPESRTVSEGAWLTFKVQAKGRSLHYQWYYRTSASGAWKAVSAASGTTANFGLTALAKRSGYQYKCVVTNLMGSVSSKIVTLLVE